MQLKSIELQNLPDNEVLYLKKWQSNGYYPLEKAVRCGDKYRVHLYSGIGWSEVYLEYTQDNFWYMLKHNHFLVTDTPMRNISEFNFE